MNQSLLKSDLLAISHRSDLALLTVRWLDDAAPAELRRHYDSALATAREAGVAHLLLDVRRRSAPGPAAATWVAHDWLPRMVAALAPRRVCLAYLISPLRAELLATEPRISALAADYPAGIEPGFCLETFVDEGEAVRWLQAQ